MLDFADVVAINKFERRGAEDARRDVAPPARPQPRGVRRRRGRTCRCSAPAPRASTTTASPRSTSTCAMLWPSTGCRSADGVLAAGRRQGVAPGSAAVVPARPGPLPRRDRRHRARLPRRTPRSRSPLARRRQPADRARPDVAARPCRPAAETARGVAGRAEASSSPDAAAALAGWPAPGRAVLRRRARRTGPRPGAAHARCAGTTLSGTSVPRVALPRTPTTASCCGSCAARTCPAASRSPPGCSRSSARARTRPGCSPARATRSAPTAASTCSPRASPPPGCPPRSTRSPSTAATPAERPGHLRQGRHVRRVDRDPRRHEGPLRRLRPLRARPRRCR